jgi:hypothetical protein
MDDINDRIENLKRDAAALSGGKMVTGIAPNCRPEIQEQFWKNVLAFRTRRRFSRSTSWCVRASRCRPPRNWTTSR